MLYFEDLKEGQQFDLGKETLTHDDIVAFAEQWDPQPFHLNEDGAVESVFDSLVASGLHTLCLGSLMMVRDVLNDMSNMGGRGISSINFPHPVYPGDTLSGQVTIAKKSKPSQRSDRGDIQFELVLRNQNDNKVIRTVYHNIIGCRPS